MLAGRLETLGVVIVLFCHTMVGVAENKRSIADVLWIVDGYRGRSGVAKQMRRDALAESRFGMGDDPARERFCLEVRTHIRDP